MWSQRVLLPVDTLDEFPPTHVLEELWSALGVEPALVETVTQEVLIFWKNDSLLVHVLDRSKGDMFEQVSGALLGLWKFRSFWPAYGLQPGPLAGR